MNRFHCSGCGLTYSGFPFEMFDQIIDHHKTCTNQQIDQVRDNK